MWISAWFEDMSLYKRECLTGNILGCICRARVVDPDSCNRNPTIGRGKGVATEAL